MLMSLQLLALQPNPMARFFGSDQEMESCFLNAYDDRFVRDWYGGVSKMRQFFLTAYGPASTHTSHWFGGPDNMREQFLNAAKYDPIGFFGDVTREEIKFDEYRNPFAVIEASLISYVFWTGWPRIPTNRLIVGDSGGFSVATVGASVDPEAVIRWQIRNTDIGYILDIPPYRSNGSSARATGKSIDHLADSLKRTLSNVRRALPIYKTADRPFKWWGVCQGETRPEQERWYDAVTNVYGFDQPGEGWAMRPHPNNDLASIARCLRFCKDHNIKSLHLLQTTGAKAIAVALALGEMGGLEFLTYDSETAARLGIARTAIVRPSSYPVMAFKQLSEVSRRGETFTRDYMLSGACLCEGCQWYREDKLDPLTEYAHYIMLHNYCIMRDNFKAIAEAAAKDPEALLKLATGKRGGEVHRAYDNPFGTSAPSSRRVSVLDRLK